MDKLEKDKEKSKKPQGDSTKQLTFLEKNGIRFLFKPNFEKFFAKFLNSTTENYIFHSEINILNEEDKSFIFLTKSQVVITQEFNHLSDEEFNENPIQYKIDYSQVKTL